MSQHQMLRSIHRLTLVAAAVAASAFMVACSGDDKGAAGATQAAARVNDSEVTVHQINTVLERQPGLTPEQIEPASKQVLEGLIDQELAVQKAEETELDRDPKVVQLLDSTRRAVLARQYYEKASSTAVAAPTSQEIEQYFNDNPGLFSNRRTYMLQEFNIQVAADQVDALKAQLQAAPNAKAFLEVLKAAGVKASVNQVTQPAESLPLQLVDRISKLADGQAMYESSPTGLKAILVVASRLEPLTMEQAKPRIERFLTETRRVEWLKNHVKSLRDAAKVEYLGKFTAPAAAGAASGAQAPAASSDADAAAAALAGGSGK
jgi:EpsD family peptidyl-prolyl cis-trans isomerase